MALLRAVRKLQGHVLLDSVADGRYSARAAAQLLNVDVSTIADWCLAGHLDYVQEVTHGPRWVKLTPDVIATLRKPVKQRKPRHSSTQT